jgi:hypothetical protein
MSLAVSTKHHSKWPGLRGGPALNQGLDLFFW